MSYRIEPEWVPRWEEEFGEECLMRAERYSFEICVRNTWIPVSLQELDNFDRLIARVRTVLQEVEP
jgi:hypothetical protein